MEYNNVLTDKQKDFLKVYKPLSKYITNFNECNQITDILSLKELNFQELMAIRNSVVLFYTELIKTDEKECMTSLMSVTAVIDNFIYNI